MTNVMINVCSRQFMAILMVCWLFLAPAASAATGRAAIPADPCGPGVALQSAGHSFRLVPQLQHEDGSPLLPSEVRTAPDKVFYLSVGAQPDSAKYAEFISAENAKFGVAQGPCIVKGPGCKEQLAVVNKRADELNAALGVANKRADKLKVDLDAANQRIDRLKAAYNAVNKRAHDAEANEGISPWWLLLLLAIPAVWFWMRRGQLKAEEQAEEASQMLNTTEYARKQAEADMLIAKKQRDAANEQVLELQKILQQGRQNADEQIKDLMTARWNDADELRAHLAELEARPPAES